MYQINVLTDSGKKEMQWHIGASWQYARDSAWIAHFNSSKMCLVNCLATNRNQRRGTGMPLELKWEDTYSGFFIGMVSATVQ